MFLSMADQNQITEISFVLHRARGSDHVPGFHPHVIGQHCSCMEDGLNIFLKRRQPVGEFSEEQLGSLRRSRGEIL